jgi:threonine dehydratase
MTNIAYSLQSIPAAAFLSARERIADVGEPSGSRTPLLRLNVEDLSRGEARDAPAEIYLKLENLQPTGAFKLRGAANAIRLAPAEQLRQGVWTASTGNMAQGMAGLFIHAFSDAGVMAGNGTAALEILEDLPDVDAVITPYGGGGLICGVAAAFRHFKADTRLYAAEVESAAPVAASLAAGEAVEVEYKASFVDGIGAPFLFDEMWDFARHLLDGSIVVTLEQTVAAIRLLAQRNRVIAEGAGAAAVAAALTGKAGSGKVVCVVSGGNIDAGKLAKIFAGEMP